MQKRIDKHFERLGELPLKAEVTSPSRPLLLDEGFSTAIEMLKKARTTFIFGNGGSAAIASHMAEDYTKNGGIRMMAFNDAPMLTCFANDMGYENVFKSAIAYYAEPKDLIIAISSSGKSENILNAVRHAAIIGCPVITLSGFKPDNPLRQLGNLNFYVPDESYGNVEITHLSLLHAALDFICEDKK